MDRIRAATFLNLDHQYSIELFGKIFFFKKIMVQVAPTLTARIES